jgi:hypothetical protein
LVDVWQVQSEQGSNLMAIESFNGGVVVTGPHIELVRLLSIQGRLGLEMKGIRFRGRSTFAIVKEQFGLKGNNAKVKAAFDKIVEDKKAELAPKTPACDPSLDHLIYDGMGTVGDDGEVRGSVRPT